ncbi:DUF554 domain-containing protein [Kosakonia cowanii]
MKIRAIMSFLTRRRNLGGTSPRIKMLWYAPSYSFLWHFRSVNVLTGPFINAAAVLIGGTLGALMSHRLPERVRSSMPSIFGLASLGIGILLVVKCVHLPVMVLATLLGTLIGELCYVERGIGGGVNALRKLAQKRNAVESASSAHESFIQSLVAIIILFCASGTGIFGAMREGMTGDPSILIAKAFLDFFTALIFATSLGFAVAIISVPMLIIQLTLATCATLILPLTTPAMMGDFTAVGGILLLATGLRICGIKMFAVANMLPALVLAMPLSALWTAFFA